jgi:hypothetical protein
MTRVDRVIGGVLAVAAVAALVGASHVRLTSHASPEAVLRLAWSARPERIETCREQTAEELARLPRHMRQPVVCEGAAAHYRLIVRLGGHIVAEQLVRAGGLRQDRRLYVFREVAVPVGDADVEVRFERVASSAPAISGDQAGRPRPARPDQGQSAETVPPRLAFAQRLWFPARAVVLVTYDPERRALVAVQNASGGVTWRQAPREPSHRAGESPPSR